MPDLKINISQSLIKRAREVIRGTACGYAFHEIDILKKYKTEPSDAQKLGSYFEYLCIGTPNRDGTIPEMPATQKGLPTADAIRAQKQKVNFDNVIQEYGFEIINTNKTTVNKINDKYSLKIIEDAEIKTKDGSIATLDLKFSGLLGDKWQPMGWHLESYKYRDQLTIQPIMYKYVNDLAYGIHDKPFYYGIFSSKNEYDFDFWEVNIEHYDEVMGELDEEISDLIGIFDSSMDTIALPNPEYSRCNACPINEMCVFRALTPTIKHANIVSLKNETGSI